MTKALTAEPTHICVRSFASAALNRTSSMSEEALFKVAYSALRDVVETNDVVIVIAEIIEVLILG